MDSSASFNGTWRCIELFDTTEFSRKHANSPCDVEESEFVEEFRWIYGLYGQSAPTSRDSWWEGWFFTESNLMHLDAFQGTATYLQFDQIPQFLPSHQAHEAVAKTQKSKIFSRSPRVYIL
jgi:hypothetical protein